MKMAAKARAVRRPRAQAAQLQYKRQKRSADFIRAPRSIRFPALALGGGRLTLSANLLASQAHLYTLKSPRL